AGSKSPKATRGSRSVTSTAFIITPAAGTALAFVQQPTQTPGGAWITPMTVLGTEAFGNPVPNVSVTMALPAGSTATLSGTTTQSTDSSGIATFANLSINIGGTYTLIASSTGLTSATRGSVTVIEVRCTASIAPTSTI